MEQRRPSSALSRLLAFVIALALLGTACSADDSVSTSADTSASTDAVEDAAGSSSDTSDRSTAAGESEPAAADEAMSDEEGGAVFDDASEAADEAMEEAAAAVEEAAAAADVDALTAEEDVAPPIEEPPATPAPQPQSGLLTAADIDDNLNFSWFERILSDWILEQGQQLPGIDLNGRITIEVTAPNGVGLGNTEIVVTDGRNNRTIVTDSAGTAYLYPAWLGLDGSQDLRVAVGDTEVIVGADRNPGPVEITVEGDTTPPSKLDVALVLDVTGSMSDELRYLTVEFESIIERVAADYGNVDMRFALVVYRDTTDDFTTRTFDFTGNVSEMRNWLADQSANGGGDFPEAMDAAMRDAEEFSWRSGDDVARVLVLNADAPPHTQNIARTLDAARGLGSRGVRIYPLAASGVDRSAEFLMRTMAATTGGRHLFLTGDSGIGGEKLEPKAQCYVVTGLDDLLYRVLATELAGERIEPADAQVVRTVGTYDRGRCA